MIKYLRKKYKTHSKLPPPAPDLRLLKRVLREESEERGFLAPSSYSFATCRSIDVTYDRKCLIK